MRNAVLAAGLVAALAGAGCTWNVDTTRDYKPAKTLGPRLAQPGSEWSYVRRDSGSFGSGVSHVSFKSLPMQNWQGRQNFAYQGPDGTTLIEPTSGRWVAVVRDGKPLASWDPPVGYHWPLWLGETWSAPYRVTNHATGKTNDIRATFTVEAQETVNVPAGTFRAYRIRYADPFFTATSWYSPDIGLFVKSRQERHGNHPAGPGVREQDLLRVSIKQ
jgi:hypothetical protein